MKTFKIICLIMLPFLILRCSSDEALEPPAPVDSNLKQLIGSWVVADVSVSGNVIYGGKDITLNYQSYVIDSSYSKLMPIKSKHYFVDFNNNPNVINSNIMLEVGYGNHNHGLTILENIEFFKNGIWKANSDYSEITLSRANQSDDYLIKKLSLVDNELIMMKKLKYESWLDWDSDMYEVVNIDIELTLRKI